MGLILAPPDDLIQRIALALKRWLQEIAPSTIACAHPLGEYVDGRTLTAVAADSGLTPKAPVTGKSRTPWWVTGVPRAFEELISRKHGVSVRLTGRTGGIECTVSIGAMGDVCVSFKGLPHCLIGIKPILAFPTAARTDTIEWELGPRPGIVRAPDAVATTGELECRVARLAPEAAALPELFGRIRIMSPEGDAQPACSIGVAVERSRD